MEIMELALMSTGRKKS